MQVEEFLRGPQQQANFTGIFPSLPDARKWAKKHFKHGQERAAGMLAVSDCGTYSARAEPDGRGGWAFCTVTKTQDWFCYQCSEREQARISKALAAAVALRRQVQQ